MRVATGLLLTLWLLFMGYMFMSTAPVEGGADGIRAVTGVILLTQVIAWAFSFTKPFVSFVVLMISTVLSLLAVFSYGGAYIIIAVVSVVFALMSLAGHKEKSRTKAKAI